VDYEHLGDKLIVGDKVLIDYGGIVLTVIGFETEEKYLVNQERKKKLQENLGATNAAKKMSPSSKDTPVASEEVKNSPGRTDPVFHK
jgi:pyruvate kinase